MEPCIPKNIPHQYSEAMAKKSEIFPLKVGVMKTYYKTSHISVTDSKNLNDFRFVVHFSLPNPLKPYVKSRMKM